MPLQQRLLLLCGALFALLMVVNKIKKEKILMTDAIYWVVFSVILMVVAAIPELAFFFSRLLGFQSPSNFVFLAVVALLFGKVFSDAAAISLLKNRVDELTQEMALRGKAPQSAPSADDSDATR